MREGIYVIKVKTLTPLWTGDVDRKCSRIKETGIIGSLRWWYEALVRGLGGYACDPTSDDLKYKKCELDQKRFQRSIREGKSIQEALDEQICPACQLFGCTGWRKKIQFEIKNIEGIFREGFEGKFDLLIKELKPLREEEKWLLKKTIRTIGNYGSIGGRTTRKPHYNPKRPTAGKDYGLVNMLINIEPKVEKKNVESWLESINQKLKKNNNPEWPNLKYFFFIKGKFLNRIQINKIMDTIPYLKGKAKTQYDIGRSKRIFSFKADKGRIWGYVKGENMLNETIKLLKEKLALTYVLRFEDVIR